MESPYQVRVLGRSRTGSGSHTGSKQGDWSLKVIESGYSQYFEENISYDLTAGSLWLCRGQGLVRHDHSEPLHTIHVRFRGSYASFQAERIREAWGAPVITSPLCSTIRNLLLAGGPTWNTDLPNDMGRPECALAQALTALWAACFTPPQAGVSGPAILAYLHEQRDSATDLYRFASDLQISRATLCRRVRDYCNESVQQLHERIRLDYACELLQQTPLPIQAVAKATGFHDQRYFANRFRRKFSCSAREFRMQNSA